MRNSTPLPPPEHAPWQELPAESGTGGGEFDTSFLPEHPDQWGNSHFPHLPLWPLPSPTTCGFSDSLQGVGIHLEP